MRPAFASAASELVIAPLSCAAASLMALDLVREQLGFFAVQALNHAPTLDIRLQRTIDVGNDGLFLVGGGLRRHFGNDRDILLEQFVRLPREIRIHAAKPLIDPHTHLLHHEVHIGGERFLVRDRLRQPEIRVDAADQHGAEPSQRDQHQHHQAKAGQHPQPDRNIVEES
jgi:hypothetical protein